MIEIRFVWFFKLSKKKQHGLVVLICEACIPSFFPAVVALFCFLVIALLFSVSAPSGVTVTLAWRSLEKKKK